MIAFLSILLFKTNNLCEIREGSTVQRGIHKKLRYIQLPVKRSPDYILKTIMNVVSLNQTLVSSTSYTRGANECLVEREYLTGSFKRSSNKMSEFDAFESSDPQQNAEEDPAAAFLAREQTELAGLEDDNFGVDNSVPQEQNDYDPFGAGQPTNTDGADFLGGDQMGGQGSSGLLDFGDSPPLTDGEQYTNGPTDAYSMIAQQDKERAEPEQIRIWREEQTKRLEKKDAEEEKKMEDWRQSAKKELDDWYKHNADQLEKTKENNREAEEAFVKERDETQPGGEWEKICRLCEFNPKNSKNTKDVSRLRGILLQLKQTPLVR